MLGFATGASGRGVAGKPILLLAGAEDAGAPGWKQAYDDLSPIKRFVSIDTAAPQQLHRPVRHHPRRQQLPREARGGGLSHPAEPARARHRRLSPGESRAGGVLEGGPALHRRPPARGVRPGRSADRARRRHRRRVRADHAALSLRRRRDDAAARRARFRRLRVRFGRRHQRRRRLSRRIQPQSRRARAAARRGLRESQRDGGSTVQDAGRRRNGRMGSTSTPPPRAATPAGACAQQPTSPGRTASRTSTCSTGAPSAACAAFSAARSPTPSSTRRCATAR